MDKSAGSMFSSLIYGVKVILTSESKTRVTVMMLNQDNNFFLEFVEYKDKLKIKKAIFLPYIKNVRAKPESIKLKIRMRNEDDKTYLSFGSIQKLMFYEEMFNKLVQRIQPFHYSIYRINNHLYFALYELKIFKNKDKIFTEKDVQFIIDTIKIRKKKYKKNFEVNSTIKDTTGNITISRTNSHRNDMESNVDYCRRIQKKMEKLLDKGKPLDMKIILEIFEILIEKEELISIFDHYTMDKQERNSVLHGMSNRSFSLWDINPKSIVPDRNKRMNFENLMAFIQENQHEKIDGELIETLNCFFQSIRVESIFDTPNESEVKDITFTEFCCYIFSEINSIFDPDKKEIHHDLEHPLAAYTINSSHNTYLVGHQLYGKTTVEGIERAIEQGCRCIELDCWDGKDNEPIVTHGHTLTSEYPFSKMVEKLSKIAFSNNKFPLILSLETHCCLEQREKMATYLKKYFGKRLLTLNTETVQKKFKLSQLMKTVIIKSDSNYPDSFGSPIKKNGDPREWDNDSLSCITALFKEKMQYFDLQTPFSMISSKESKFFECFIRNDDYMKIKRIANQNLIRIYPDAKRVESSNYNPIECWFTGAHMVALNIQYKDEYTLINRIKFLENGGHKGGFLLKPNYIRSNASLTINKFQVEVVSGQIICDSLLDENDFLEIYVVAPDREHKNEKYTLHFSSNFIHPSILQKYTEPIQFTIIYPEMSFLVFKVRNNSQNIKLIGAIPFSCIRSGIRVLDLYDRSLFLNCFSYILVQITKK